MKTILKVETKYNENLADAQVLVVTLLSNVNRTWDFIVDADAYHTLRLNEDYLVTTQDDWLGTIVGIRFETVANAINLKATVLKHVPDDDQVEVLDETEDDTENVDFPLTPTPWMVWANLKHMSDDTEENHQLNVVNVRSSILDLLLFKRFAEDKLSELNKLSDKEVDAYNKDKNEK